MSTDSDGQDLRAALSPTGEKKLSLATVLESVVKMPDPEVNVTSQSVEARKSEWKKELDKLPLEKLATIRSRMTGFVDSRFSKVTKTSDQPVMTQEEVDTLMSEVLDIIEMKIFLDARYEMARLMTFGHLTQKNIDEGVPDPEHHNGSINSPQHGKRFAREGFGESARKPPSVDWDKMKSKMTAEEWESIITRVPVIKETVNEDKLLDKLQKDPKLLERLRDCTIPGDYRTPKFAVRNIQEGGD